MRNLSNQPGNAANSGDDAPTPAHILGIGLDAKDGHKRITQAEEFTIMGGSEETHERMSETLIKTVETVHKKGKNLSDTSSEELRDIIEDSRPG